MMEKRNGKNIIEILKNEYGFTSEKDLDRAIAEIGFIDISVFCLKAKEKKVKAS